MRLEAIADKLLTAMYGGGTNENRIIDAIDLAPSLVDVSRVHDKFGIEKGYVAILLLEET